MRVVEAMNLAAKDMVKESEERRIRGFVGWLHAITVFRLFSLIGIYEFHNWCYGVFCHEVGVIRQWIEVEVFIFFFNRTGESSWILLDFARFCST